MHKVEPTAQVIDHLAEELESAARRARVLAQRMRQDGDFSQAPAALSLILDLPSRVRLDLLVSRPIRDISSPTNTEEPRENLSRHSPS